METLLFIDAFGWLSLAVSKSLIRRAKLHQHTEHKASVCQ